MSQPLQLSLVLKADAAGFVGEVRVSKAELDQLTAAAGKTAQAADGAGRALDGAGKDAAQAATRIGQAGTAASAAGQALSDTQARADALGAAYRALASQIDPVYAAEQRLAAGTQTLDAALKAGIISQETFAQRLKQLQNQFGATSAAARQQRAVYQNLGYQVQDTFASFASGIHPLVILAQQGGQTASALSGLGGMVGRVAGFLAGPWGAAAMGAVTVTALLSNQMRDTAQQTDAQTKATMSLADATEALTKLTGVSLQTRREQIAQAKETALATLAEARATQAKILATIELIEAEQELRKTRRDGFGTGGETVALGIAAGDRQLSALRSRLPGLAKDVADAEAAVRGTGIADMLDAVAARTDKVAAANRAYKQTEEELTQQVIHGRKTRAQAEAELLEAAKKRDAAINAAAEERGAEKRAAKEAKADAKERRQELEAEGKTAASTARSIDSLRQAYDKFGATWDKLQADTISLELLKPELDPDVYKSLAEGLRKAKSEAIGKEAVDLLDKQGLVAAMQDAGREGWRRFHDEGVIAIEALGQVIGGKLGRRVSDLAALMQGLQSGDFTGLNSRAGGILTLLAGGKDGKDGGLSAAFGKNSPFAQGMDEVFAPTREALKKLGDTLTRGLGESGMKMLGKAFAGASTGQMVDGLMKGLGIKGSSTGAQIGGSIGAMTGIPGGDIIGSILGSLIGGAFKKTKKSSATLVSEGGQLSVGSVTGTSQGRRDTASSLGGAVVDGLQQIADAFGAELGNLSVSVGTRKKKYVVDSTGSGRTKGSGTTKYDTAEEAVTAAIVEAINDGVLTGLSTAVQMALKSSSDLNKAISEATKVQGLERLIADRGNSFSSAFADLEKQAAERLKVAKKYGFNLVEIEKINAEERNKAVEAALSSATGSIKALLDELTWGDMAEGSAIERRSKLTAERDALVAKAATGDTDAADKLAQVSAQLVELSAEIYGSGAEYAADRASTIAVLNQVVADAEAKIRAASDAAVAKYGTGETDPQLAEANSSLDDITSLSQQQLAALSGINANLLAYLQANVGGTGITGIAATILAKSRGVSV